jgi:hypothetical protein
MLLAVSFLDQYEDDILWNGNENYLASITCGCTWHDCCLGENYNGFTRQPINLVKKYDPYNPNCPPTDSSGNDCEQFTTWNDKWDVGTSGQGVWQALPGSWTLNFHFSSTMPSTQISEVRFYRYTDTHGSTLETLFNQPWRWPKTAKIYSTSSPSSNLLQDSPGCFDNE